MVEAVGCWARGQVVAGRGLAAPLPRVGCGGWDGGPGFPHPAAVGARDSKVWGQLGLGAARDQPRRSPALVVGGVLQMWPSSWDVRHTRVGTRVWPHLPPRPESRLADSWGSVFRPHTCAVST